MPLTFDQHPAKVVHLNIRKEGPDDEKHLMVDMKLEIQADAEVLGDFDPTLHGFMFREGEPRYPRMGPVKWSGEIKHNEFEIAGLEFNEVTLRKFQLKPLCIAGHEVVFLSMTATFAPSGRETAIIAEQVGEECAISLRPQPQMSLEAAHA